jgi:hypothetical protein
MYFKILFIILLIGGIIVSIGGIFGSGGWIVVIFG